MTSSIKPEVHDVSQRRQWTTEPWSQATCMKIGNTIQYNIRLIESWQFGLVVFELRKQTNKQTNRYTHRRFLKSCTDKQIHTHHHNSSFLALTQPAFTPDAVLRGAVRHTPSFSPKYAAICRRILQQVLPKVIWEEGVATLTSENVLSHCVR